MDTISIPWKKTITDPFGNPHEITETFNVSIEDIWKWQQFYIQNSEDNIVIEKGVVSNKRSAGHAAKIGISLRLGYAENGTDKRNKTESIDFLVDGLKKYKDPLLGELITANLDRLRDISKMPEASDDAKIFLHKILGKK